MQKAKFKVTLVDRETRTEYPVSDVFVEVSDAFAKRIKNSDPEGLKVVFEDDENQSDNSNDADLKKLADNRLIEIESLKAEKETILNERSHFEIKLSEANTSIEEKDSQIAELNDTISSHEALIQSKDNEIAELLLKDVKDSAKEEPKKESLFDEKTKDKK